MREYHSLLYDTGNERSQPSSQSSLKISIENRHDLHNIEKFTQLVNYHLYAPPGNPLCRWGNRQCSAVSMTSAPLADTMLSPPERAVKEAGESEQYSSHPSPFSTFLFLLWRLSTKTGVSPPLFRHPPPTGHATTPQITAMPRSTERSVICASSSIISVTCGGPSY